MDLTIENAKKANMQQGEIAVKNGSSGSSKLYTLSEDGESLDVFPNFSLIYPIGSIYLSAISTNPQILFGFGEAEHILTVNEMPKHTHRFKTDINSPDYNVTWPEWTEYTTGWAQESNETESPASQVTYNGGDQPHNNMPPYLTVYMWKRVG